MRKSFFFSLVLIAGLLASCTTVRSLGDLNLVSSKNINMEAPNVQLLSSAQEMTKAQIKRSARATTMEDAVTQAVNKVPGGVCLGNVQVYYVDRGMMGTDQIVVSGDVWGVPGGDFQGFRTGDAVIYMQYSTALEAKIIAFKDNTVAVITITKNGLTKEVPIANLRKP